jgi:UTP:GlnB (protein PII) uridylyltransferase
LGLGFIIDISFPFNQILLRVLPPPRITSFYVIIVSMTSPLAANRTQAENYRKDLLLRFADLVDPQSIAGIDDPDHQKYYLEYKNILLGIIENETQLLQKELKSSENAHLLLLKRTALVDTVVQTSFHTAIFLYNHRNKKNIKADDIPIAIAAKGGYGREEMYFRSDVDIQIITKFSSDAEVSETAKEIINYFEYIFVFQDILPGSGHTSCSVISSTQSELDEKNPASFFSLMEHRYITGDPSVYSDFKNSVKSAQTKNESAIIKYCLQHKTYYEIQNTVFQQEPNLNDELRRLYWALALIRIREGLETTNRFELLYELLKLGKISGPAFVTIQYGLNFLARARMFLHCCQKGAHRDMLSYEVREEIATEMGFTVQEFYKEYFLKSVLPLKRHSRNIFWEAQVFDSEKVKDLSENYAINAENQIIFAKDPASYQWDDLALFLEPFCWMSKENYHLSFPVTRALEQNMDQILPMFQAGIGEHEIQNNFKNIIEGKYFAKTIRSLHEFKLLETCFIPEFRNISGLLQDILVHKFPTDMHVLTALDELNKFETELETDEFLTSLYHSLKEKTILKLSVLLHDIGKGLKAPDENEELAGAQAAPHILEKLGYDRDHPFVPEVAYLIEKHLMMADLLLLDPDEDDTYDMIWDLVNQDPECLKMLILLTYADRAGTKMKMSSTLISQLKYFYQGTLYHQKREDVSDAIKLEFAKMIRLPRDLQSQIGVYNEFRHSQQNFAANMFFNAGEPAMLVVCSKDQRGLLFDIAAILAFNRLTIVDANIHTLDHNVLDVFKVNASTGDPIEYSDFFFTLEQVKKDMQKVIVGDISVEEHYHGRTLTSHENQKPYEKIKLKIKIIGRAVKIETQNLLGTVMMQTRVFADLGMEIQRAVIHTQVESASNVFYLRPEDVREIIQGEEKFRKTMEDALLPLLDSKPIFTNVESTAL